MRKILMTLIAVEAVGSAGAAMADEGRYSDVTVREGAVSIDRSTTGSIETRGDMRFKTSRDNRLPFDDQGNFRPSFDVRN